MAAPQQQGSPAYVVYKVGGDPGDYQFLYERPKRSRTDTCARLCETQQWAAAIQAQTEGLPGASSVRREGQLPGVWGATLKAVANQVCRCTIHESSLLLPPPRIRSVQSERSVRHLPKKKIIGYSKPYPNEFDLIPLPPKYRLPDFTKFSGSEGSSSIEHVSRYLAQLGMVSASDQLRVRFFSQSLTGPAFGCYEAGIAELAQVRQRRGETVSEYIQRFRTVKNRCYSVHLTEKEAVELAVAGLAASFKDLTFQVEYNSLAHMVQRLTLYEQRHPELYQDKCKRAISLVNADEDEDSAEDRKSH
ncbi:hypothetical protein QYE76_047139 [Lolium multiflorum]|uniref:Retrotransposon gag domain-containing protein n=1 Tax=Lolium multiflorum TaxID=4521 RepID=A0AAD8TRC0_LOLMU|nr:hypothetical protein QYE76_047139 [Lolium multiflorum]